MKTLPTFSLALVALLTTSVAYTRNAPAPAEADSAPRTACLVDDHLSVWMSLAEVNKTLKRRRMQRARLEEWLNLYIGASPADGS